MKKSILLLMVLIIISCANTDVKLIKSISNEIGSEENIKKINENFIRAKWENVSIGKSTLIKNTLDNEIGMLPTKESGLISLVPGRFSQYWIYETPNIKVELDYIYDDDVNSETMTVELHITNK